MAVLSYIHSLPLLVILLLILWWRKRTSRPTQQRQNATDTDSEKQSSTADPYQDIEPLLDFDWSTTEPIQIRPFKPKYHLTMGLETCPLSELIVNDRTYVERMNLRKALFDSHRNETIQCNKVCEAAVFEMYEWIFGTYLPRRFPTMYKLIQSNELGSDAKISTPALYNIAADKYIPLHESSPHQALCTLGYHVDTDILILLPSSTADDGSPIYHLQAFVTCFPAGFRTEEKLGLPLAGIHRPVPGYKAKLEKSMDRFFAKMELGKAVRRANWSITTDDRLYSQGGNHLYEEDKTKASPESEHEPTGNNKTLDVNAPDIEKSIEQQRKEVVIEDCRLRCERQTLHRLPKTKALVFMFKTYQYKLDDVKAEGSGPALADAIDGLTRGNVPDMAFYKRQIVWGESVTEYLRR